MAKDQEKADSAARSATVLVDAVCKQILPTEIITRKALENVISVIVVLGGSINALWPLLAIAHGIQRAFFWGDLQDSGGSCGS